MRSSKRLLQLCQALDLPLARFAQHQSPVAVQTRLVKGQEKNSGTILLAARGSIRRFSDAGLCSANFNIRTGRTPFQTDSYGAAHAAGLLPLMWLAFVVAAPLGEEMPGGLALEGRSWLR